jgi:peptidoglycan/LPS O-acetylase OafA/YrhL
MLDESETMIGYLRFLLATLVLLSHLDVRTYGLNPGVVAVVMFYLLAGNVINHLWYDVLVDERGRLYAFYRDRVLRIFPLYLYVLALTVLFIVITQYGGPEFELKSLIYNLTIIPLNYFMYLDSTILTEPDWNLIPPAWSLGTELQAYLLMPLLFMNRKIAGVLFIVSMFIYTLANFHVIHTDYFGYRLLPGVLFIFLLGSMIKEIERYKTMLMVTWLFVFAQLLYIESGQFVPQVYARETLIGLVLGIPLLMLLTSLNFKIAYSKLLGAMSYGLFLSHFLMIWLLNEMQYQYGHSLYIASVIAGSCLISLSGIHFIEKRIDYFRIK